ncbi:MAG TPA: hypothetical protein VGD02_05755, partial [Gemmatimonadaceae bacterium]
MLNRPRFRALTFLAVLAVSARAASAQVDLPPSAMTAGRDTAPQTVSAGAPLVLTADLDAHIL